MTSRRPEDATAESEQEEAHERVGRLYEQYASRLGAYALRRTSRADAADVVAETFLVAWRRRDVIPAEPSTLPWLYGVARRVLANQHRSRHRRGRLHERLTTQFTTHEAPSARLEVAEGFERVAVALGKLSDNDAELLRLSGWEDLSPSDIATVMGIEPEAVRQRLHRARKRLRKQLSAGKVEHPQHAQMHDMTARAAMRNPTSGLLWELSEYGR